MDALVDPMGCAIKPAENAKQDPSKKRLNELLECIKAWRLKSETCRFKVRVSDLKNNVLWLFTVSELKTAVELACGKPIKARCPHSIESLKTSDFAGEILESPDFEERLGSALKRWSETKPKPVTTRRVKVKYRKTWSRHSVINHDQSGWGFNRNKPPAILWWRMQLLSELYVSWHERMALNPALDRRRTLWLGVLSKFTDTEVRVAMALSVMGADDTRPFWDVYQDVAGYVESKAPLDAILDKYPLTGLAERCAQKEREVLQADARMELAEAQDESNEEEAA